MRLASNSNGFSHHTCPWQKVFLRRQVKERRWIFRRTNMDEDNNAVSWSSVTQIITRPIKWIYMRFQHLLVHSQREQRVWFSAGWNRRTRRMTTVWLFVTGASHRHTPKLKIHRAARRRLSKQQLKRAREVNKLLRHWGKPWRHDICIFSKMILARLFSSLCSPLWPTLVFLS